MARRKHKAAGLKALIATFRRVGFAVLNLGFQLRPASQQTGFAINHFTLSPLHAIRRQQAKEGAEEVITGRELNKWLRGGVDDWKKDPVNAIGEGVDGEVCLPCVSLGNQWL